MTWCNLQLYVGANFKNLPAVFHKLGETKAIPTSVRFNSSKASGFRLKSDGSKVSSEGCFATDLRDINWAPLHCSFL